MFVRNSSALTFIKRKKIAQDTYSFSFLRPHNTYTFLPGQSIWVDLISGKETYSREFTIASSPLDKKYIVIVTKQGNSEFKKELFHLRSGTTVACSSPSGGFYLDENNKIPKVFLAGGIGITPFYSMITYAVEKKLSIPITLIASFSTKEDMIFYEELRNITKNNNSIKIIYTLTKPAASWEGEIGRISKTLIEKYSSDTKNAMYYIVGSPQMVIETEELLEEMGIRLEHIKVEPFTGY